MRCKVMGIVNVTPDSFSDGGKYYTSQEAVRRARNLVVEGADIIDLGAESTRPGAERLEWTEEWARLKDVLEGLRDLCVPVSVDTYHPETARMALEAGAKIINCVYEESVPEMLELCAAHGAEIVLPAKALKACSINSDGTLAAKSGDVPFYADPMIGFGTSREEDLELLKSVSQLAASSRVLVGASRKRIVKKLTGEKMTGKNLGGNLGIAVWCAMSGASVVRVHDVKETVQALKVIAALKGE